MPLLDLKVQEYKMLIDKQVHLQFDSGFSFNIRFKTVNFPHLVGLHQYTDINLLKKLNERKIPAKSIWKQLKNKKITMEKLSKSVHYKNPLISSRIKEFSYERFMSLFSQEIVIYYKPIDRSDFDVNILLYEKEFGLYYLLGLKLNDDTNYYPASFLVRSDTKYIENQLTQKAKRIQVEELSSGRIIRDTVFGSKQETTA